MSKSDRLLPSIRLVERVLAADVSYTISRMRVLERIPGNPIGIAYRWIDETAVALLSRFLPSFTRVVGFRPGHERQIESIVAWYREHGVRPTFELVPGVRRRVGARAHPARVFPIGVPRFPDRGPRSFRGPRRDHEHRAG